MRRLRWLRLREWLKRRGTRIRLALLVYLFLCVLPLLLVPPVAYMAYLLAWHEYHR